MKKFTLIILSVCFLFIGFLANSQTEVTLVIDHKLGANDFQMNQNAQNNLGNDFKLSRMEYYITRFSVIHDGGQVLAVDDNVIALVNAENYTSIPLGSLNVTSIEGIKFHIGVYQPVNTADPSLQPSSSPLSFQNPSMHWGWASGYRFIALEGLSGPSLNQTTELHGLGNQNYFETTVMASGEAINGGQVISIKADYTEGLRDINISSGLIVHATNAQAAQMIGNFRDFVFSAGQSVAGLESISLENVKVYPIPSQGKISIETPSEFIGGQATIINAQGQIVQKMDVQLGAGQSNITLDESGIFMLILETKDNEKKTFKIVNN
jgi:hypothetical protein|tara:strand:+ start:15816 stop:16784 length:969 start_codon:yes stop_codon:yes gene_type:complete